EVHLVGSHGSEFDVGFVRDLDTETTQLRTNLQRSVQGIAASRTGVTLEAKPASVAVHLRRADPETAQAVLGELRAGPASWEGIHVTEGKSVVELSVVQTNKGSAL